MAEYNPKEKEELNSEITRLTDTSVCSYEEVIDVLTSQLKFWKKAKKDEDEARKSEKQ